MARCRILAVPLALVVAIAVFVSPVLGVLPENTVTGIARLTFYPVRDGTLYSPYTRDLVLGSIHGYGFYNFGHMSYTGSTSLPYHEPLPLQYDLYVAVLTESIPNLELNSLTEYYVPYRNLTDTVAVPSSFTFVGADSYVDPPTYENTYTKDITFLCFRDVPNDFSFVIGDFNPAIHNEPGSGVGIVLEDGNFYPYFVFGFFMTSSAISSDSIVNDYNNGIIDFSHALDELGDLINQSIASASTPDEQILASLIGQQQIEQLVQSSNDKNLTVIHSSLNPGLESAIDSYVSGSVTLDQAMDSMYTEFSSALSSAATPEQGELVSTNYQIALDKLQIQAKQKALDQLDSAVSDDQLTEADDYYAAEEDLINQFDLAEFESALDFELWFNTLPPSETVLYKQFFDYLLNDSSIRMFLIVPISLVLVRILMGTHLVLGRGGDHRSKTSVLDSDDHYHFFDDGDRGY